MMHVHINIYSKKHFQFSFSVIETQNICQSGSITSQRGFISTPRYPNNYPNDEDCLVHIIVDPSQSINLTIIDMNLEINGTFGCTDWMYAYDAYRSVTLCGRRSNEKVTTLQSNEISIRFQSDRKVNKKGFWVYYEGEWSNNDSVNATLEDIFWITFYNLISIAY